MYEKSCFDILKRGVFCLCQIILRRLRHHGRPLREDANNSLFPELLIGCCHGESLIDPVVFKSFKERVYLSTPNPLHRLNIVNTACSKFDGSC